MKTLAATFILLLMFSAALGPHFVSLATANPGVETSPILAMPEETVNYTITRVNGTLWAKIDGNYPIHKIFKAGETFELNGVTYCVSPDDLSMVYPTPPGTTNIQVTVNETELSWSNFTETHPSLLHHTAVGDWSMIYSVIAPASDFFVLKIHYEHPLVLVNGSYLFLYDLNISPYLSPWSLNSTAHFTIRMETNASDIRAYTTETDSVWNPKNYTLSEDGEVAIIRIQMYSEFSKPLAGDLVVMFDDSSAQMPDEFPYWVIVPFAVALTVLAVMIYRKKRRRIFSDGTLRKTVSFR